MGTPASCNARGQGGFAWLLAVTALAFAAGASAFPPMQAAARDQVYTWTDAQGTVHFSATPPAGRKATTITIRDRVAAAARPAPASSVAPTSELEQTEAEYRRQSCAAARNDLKLLGSGRMVVQGDSAATATSLDAAERARATAQTKARIAQFCLDR